MAAATELGERHQAAVGGGLSTTQSPVVGMEGVWGGGPGPLERPTGAAHWRLATANEQMTSDCNNMELTKWTRPDGSNTSWLPRAPRCSYSFSSAPARGAATTGGVRATANAAGCSSSSEVDAEGVAGREQGDSAVAADSSVREHNRSVDGGQEGLKAGKEGLSAGTAGGRSSSKAKAGGG